MARQLQNTESAHAALPPIPPPKIAVPRMDSPRRQSPPDPESRSPLSVGRLRKPAPNSSRGRDDSQPMLHGQQQGAPSPLSAPPTIPAAGSWSRSSSLDGLSRPGTPSGLSRPGTPTLQVLGTRSPTTPTTSSDDKSKKKHSWFGRSKKDKEEDNSPPTWVAGHPQKLPYDTKDLLSAQPVRELWDDVDGNCFIHLFPRNSGKGASFRVDSAIFAASPVLTRLAFGDLNPETDSMTSSRDSQAHFSTISDPQETHVYLPIKLHSENPVAPAPPAGSQRSKKDKDDKPDPAMEDLQTLIDIRNFFAFLCGQSLVASERKSSFFQIFMTIAGLLRIHEFSNLDGSTYGQIASSSFDNYVEELGLADVRHSREKTIEGIVLGERMKSIMLYNEAFTHGVGKHEELLALKSSRYNLISPITQNRLVRAAMDLDKRTASIRLILNDFEFPSLFTGIMNSKQSEERKEGVRFDLWKDTFLGTRKFVMGLYSRRYGHWPPKAKSKKNDLETSGLNRQVLVDVYHDMSSMYDLLVDRTKLTTRTVDGVNLAQGAREEPTVRALRAVLSEYDRSSPPVKPPVPFDLPLLPSLKTTRPEFGTGDKKGDIKAITKKLKDDEIAKILRASWNDDAVLTPFVDAFREMEKRAAHGCTIADLVDLRIGQWIFMYVVLQALPMLACDAPDIKYTKGVEYFLCEAPRSGVPWASPSAAGGPGVGGPRRTWFSVGDSGGVVSLPSDLVEHGVEGIYRRSHCWEMAEKWSAVNPILNSALHEQEAINAAQAAHLGDGLPSPPLSEGLLRPMSHGGSPTRMRNSVRYSSLGMGLEALPMPTGVTPDGRSPSPGLDGRPRSAHAVDASKTFDAILADVDNQKKGKKR